MTVCFVAQGWSQPPLLFSGFAVIETHLPIAESVASGTAQSTLIVVAFLLVFQQIVLVCFQLLFLCFDGYSDMPVTAVHTELHLLGATTCIVVKLYGERLSAIDMCLSLS